MAFDEKLATFFILEMCVSYKESEPRVRELNVSWNVIQMWVREYERERNRNKSE